MLRQLGEFLVNERGAGRLVLLVVDEAQNLTLPALEEVRMLSNLETEKSKLIQIVLVGQTDLREKLGSQSSSSCGSASRSATTSGRWMRRIRRPTSTTGLRRAAIGAPLEFPADVSAVVHDRSGGVPRLINVICDAVLLFGYGADRRTIDLPLAGEALAELEATGVLAPATDDSSPRVAPVSAGIVPLTPGPGPQRVDAGSSAASQAERAAGVAIDAARDAALRAREAHLQRREEELAEQRRVLAEQARLLRDTRTEVADRYAAAAARLHGRPSSPQSTPRMRLRRVQCPWRDRPRPASGGSRPRLSLRPRSHHVVASGVVCAVRLSATRQQSRNDPEARTHRGFGLMSSAYTDLLDRITTRRARVGVVGLGYVGLPLAVELGRAGFETVGIDVDAKKVAAVNRGDSYIPDVPGELVAQLVRDKRLSATTDFSVVETLDTVNICVPTPLRKTKDPDLSYVVSAVDQIAAHLHPGVLVVLESTTYPGTTDEVLLPALERSGLKAGRDFFLAFSPERVDPGNPTFQHAQRPEGRGRLHAGMLEARRCPLRDGHRDGGARQLDPRRRDGEAAREHLPRGEHRAGERARDDVRPARHRRVGGRGCGEDEAVRLHALLSRALASAATAFRSTRSTCRGRRGRADSRHGSSSWPVTSTGRCRTSWPTRWAKR